MHCYKSRGFGSRIISPISGAVIDFLGEIYVDDTDLIVTHPDLETPEAVLECLHSSAEAWSSGLNSTTFWYLFLSQPNIILDVQHMYLERNYKYTKR